MVTTTSPFGIKILQIATASFKSPPPLFLRSKTRRLAPCFFNSFTALLVKVRAKKFLKDGLEVSSSKILRYSKTRLYVFPDPAEALIIWKFEIEKVLNCVLNLKLLKTKSIFEKRNFIFVEI